MLAAESDVVRDFEVSEDNSALLRDISPGKLVDDVGLGPVIVSDIGSVGSCVFPGSLLLSADVSVRAEEVIGRLGGEVLEGL